MWGWMPLTRSCTCHVTTIRAAAGRTNKPFSISQRRRPVDRFVAASHRTVATGHVTSMGLLSRARM